MRGVRKILPPTYIMLIRTNDKFLAARAILNTILKDKRLYCNWCGAAYDPNDFPCCDNPQVGSHIDHLKGVIKQNKEIRKTRKNDFASLKNKSFRWAVSFPAGLWHEWERCFKNSQKEKLLKPGELTKFMKEFPQFCIPKRI